MLSPFPGMDPYLEQPTFWSSFHSRLIVAIADAIEPQLGSQYYVEVEKRTYQSDSDDGLLIGIPDAAVFLRQSAPISESMTNESVVVQARPQQVTLPVPQIVNERYLEVRAIDTDEVITVIEILSPKNKRTGEGRSTYEKKRSLILGSSTNLVELDLLRGGKPMSMTGNSSPTAYRILVGRGHTRPIADLYGLMLQEMLPSFPLPLKPEDSELMISLQEIFNGVYERGRYFSRIDYRHSVPPPALSPEDIQWIDELLASVRAS
ncbi:MAG: DUF4058 family protein [Nostocaceae cyanobacterium]|nr:DUF4058 family protein [Nostocaceae cyanobacterium]